MITRIGNDAIRRVLLSSSRVVRPTISFQQIDTFAKPMCMISPKRRSIFPLQQHQQPRSFAFTTSSSPLYKQEELDEYLNSLSPARKKFMTILNEYKEANFKRQMPSRFFKMIVKAVDNNEDGVITMEEYQRLLTNIGALDKMSQEDLDEIFSELGDDELDGEKVISVKSIEERWEPFLHSLK